ncbi:PKD domain-containing protein [Galbibacter sp. EGI 63066]|uniref:PKD domain-containing protein n=1 Tax=Galbibacter sp. EGI 63066 TaxID=2993559 RepID=UPI002249A053|nr:PKD domain-containing protein [Galbibacter sp. EGI 63066]MCX2682002.1 PKD domain-containing protein [Galbibacter sp. EGI 63066]
MIKNKHTYKLKYLVGMLMLIAFSCTKEQAIPVNIDYELIVIDEDYSTPVQVKINNMTTGADAYQWILEGSTSNTMNTSRNPGTIVYEQGGEYTIRLEASNQDGESAEKEETITVYDGLSLDFDVEVIEDNYSPVEVKITNNTTGASTYEWTFEGGDPETSTEQHPQNVVFTEPGEHRIILKAATDFESYTQQQTITVKPYLEVNFGWEVAFQDDDYQAPVTLTMTGNSVSATEYHWSFDNGLPQTSTEEAPTVTFDTPGIHSITLEATNGKETEQVTKTFEVFPNTNLRTFTDVQLGINTAHNSNSIGAFFSTVSREVYSENEVDPEVGGAIGIVFFGLDDAFSFNKFVSPDEVTNETTFSSIPNATHTKIINTQEGCGCGASMSVTEFDAMEDDSSLQGLTIEETNAGSQHFTDAEVPLIVLFETEDGRKGAIKIKEFVKQGSDSYIMIDIKTQKEPN